MSFSEDRDKNAALLQKPGVITGWCKISDLEGESFLHENLQQNLTHAISIGFPLINSVIESIEKHPNAIYQQHYRTVNIRLNEEALQLSSEIQNAGFRALPVPASVSVDPLHGHLSHRMAAMLSGLGWIGRSSLLITPEYNARIRLVTVLTDLPLPEPTPLVESGCDDCRKCIDICPVNAIQDDARDIKREICYKYLESLIKTGIIEEYICGLCIKACNGG